MTFLMKFLTIQFSSVCKKSHYRSSFKLQPFT